MSDVSGESGLLPNFTVKVAGANISDQQAASLSEIRVDMSFGAPDQVTIVFIQPNLEDVDMISAAKLGEQIDVGMGYGESPATFASGKVMSLEMALSGEGLHMMTVRALNKIGLLHHGRKTRTFMNKKDSDLASTIAGECGLTPSVDATTDVIPYVVQWNQTNMEFLRERARRIGYVVYADSSKLYFKKDSNSGQSIATFKFGENIISFRPRATLTQQVAKVAVRGWDADQKAAVVGESSSPESIIQGGFSSAPNSLASSKLSASHVLTVVDHTITTASAANAQAKALLTDIGRAFYEGEIEVSGNSTLVPGAIITVEGVGATFNGNYRISTATHVMRDGGYTTFIGLSSTNNERLNTIMNGVSEGQHAYGVLPALVTNLKDPDNKGRIKVEFPIMPPNGSQNLESDWMRIATPMAGHQRGSMYMPEVGDEVLVAFEGGAPGRGYILGGLWGNKDKVPYSDFHENGVTVKRAFKSKSGHELIFGEKQGEESITLKDKAGNTLFFDAANQLIKFTAVKDMEFDIKGNLKIKATGNINMESTGTFGIKSTGAMNIEGTQAVTVKANTQLNLEGSAAATLKANGSLSLSSSGIAELKGSLVKIN